MGRINKFFSPPWSPDVMFKLGLMQVVLWSSQVPLIFLIPSLKEALTYLVVISITANILGALSWVQSAMVEKRQMKMQEDLNAKVD